MEQLIQNVDSDTLLNTLDRCVVVSGNSEPVKITLPEEPRAAQSVTVVDGDDHSAVLPITVDGNGKTINGASTLLISSNSASVSLSFNCEKWVIR